jgi:hypothetical protein
MVAARARQIAGERGRPARVQTGNLQFYLFLALLGLRDARLELATWLTPAC